MKYINLVCLALLFTACSCKKIKFEKDISFIPSAVANSPEYPVTLNGTNCKDMDGKVGFCAKRIKSNVDLIIKIAPQQYSYMAKLNCTDSIESDQNYDVIEGVSHEMIIPSEKFRDVRVFNCTIDIIPFDRPTPVAAFATFRAIVVDQDYVELSVPYLKKDYMVFGKYAYYTTYGTKQYKETPYIEDGVFKKTTVETYNMRLSHVGY